LAKVQMYAINVPHPAPTASDGIKRPPGMPLKAANIVASILKGPKRAKLMSACSPAVPFADASKICLANALPTP